MLAVQFFRRAEIHRDAVLHDAVLFEDLIQHLQRAPAVAHEIFRNDLKPVHRRLFGKNMVVMRHAQADADAVIGEIVKWVRGHESKMKGGTFLRLRPPNESGKLNALAAALALAGVLPLQLLLSLPPLQPPWPLQVFLPLQSCLPRFPLGAFVPGALVLVSCALAMTPVIKPVMAAVIRSVLCVLLIMFFLFCLVYEEPAANWLEYAPIFGGERRQPAYLFQIIFLKIRNTCQLEGNAGW